MTDELLRQLIAPANTKIVMLIMDGLGGLPLEPGGKTELETARTPHLDALAARSALGLTIPVGPGITTGSGPGHVAIFGYDPILYEFGRGPLEALGVDFEMHPEDVAARGNFCTIDDAGQMQDRRGGRIPNEASDRQLAMLRQVRVPGVEIFLERIKEHRFAFVMRGEGLEANLSESDPLKTGLPLLPVIAGDPASEPAARAANRFLEQARAVLAGCFPANMVTLRGFGKLPRLPSYRETFGLNAAAIAVNGMYRGVARLAGMEVLDVDGVEIPDQFDTLERRWKEFDFFYIHIKQTDTYGELGDFWRKVAVIEEVDAQIPRLAALQPDVVIVGGDHSSPAVMKSHSWHPVPLLLYARHVRPDGIAEFGERACVRGSLGTLPAKTVMPIALANAGRVAKYSP